MTWKRAGAAWFFALLIAGAALAQSTPASRSEFGRTDGGDVGLLVKQPGAFSGSFGFTMSDSKALAGTLGGALVADRLWFFATAQRADNRRFVTALPQAPGFAAAADGKLTALLGDGQSLAAAAGVGRDAVPSSTLSLRYTGVVSSNSFFSASILTRRTAEPAFAVFTHW